MTIEFKTKNMAVYEKLRKDVIKGRLKPGKKIIMADLAKEFGTSETPVREAIIRLESEGFVHFTPHLGAIVSKIDERELVETYIIRIELETLATKLAVPYVTDTDIDFLKKKNKDMETAIKNNNYENLGQLNKEFHLRIYSAAPNTKLHKLICDLWDTVERTQSVFAYVPERSVASIEEHKKIIQALKKRDTELAGKLMREQKNNTMETLKNYMGKND